MWAYCTEGVTLYKWACWRRRAVGSGVRPLFQYTLCQRLSWGPDIYRCSALASDSGKTLTNILTNLGGSYVSVIKGFREKLDIRRMHTCRFLLLLPCFHSFVFSFVPLDSPFFNTPFLDFKRIFYSSCCDGKCIVTSLSVLTRFAANNMSERERKRKKGLSEWPFPLHGNMLEWSGTLWPSVAHTTTFSEMANWHVFFVSLVCLIPNHQLAVDLKD